MLMDIFNSVGEKDKTEVDKKRARTEAVATEHTQSDEANKTGVWTKPDEAVLADDNLRTTKQVKSRQLGNHLHPKEMEKFAGQEKVNPDGTRGSKTQGPRPHRRQ